jgi:uncharacterized membrane protein AbrB (regulator of aidB expression)
LLVVLSVLLVKKLRQPANLLLLSLAVTGTYHRDHRVHRVLIC